MLPDILCANCVYFQHLENNLAFGSCRRHAPRPDQDNADAYWPGVSRDDWCGEFNTAPSVYESESDGQENN